VQKGHILLQLEPTQNLTNKLGTFKTIGTMIDAMCKYRNV